MGIATFIRIVFSCLLIGVLVGSICFCMLQIANHEIRLKAVEAAVAAQMEAK